MRTRNPRLAALGLALAATLLLAGCSASSPQNQLKKAQSEAASGQERTALILLRNLVQKHPDYTQGRIALGTLLLKLGDPAASAAQLEQVRQNGKMPAGVELPLAQALIQTGKFKQALEVLQPDKADTADLKAQLYAAKGEAELGLKDNQAATQSFASALAANPHLARAYADQANLALIEGKPAAAIEKADKALSLDAHSALAWMIKGNAQLAQKQVQNAAQSLKKALSNGTPDLSPAQIFFSHGLLAQTQMALGQRKQALENIRLMLQQSPKHPYPNYLRGVLAYAEKDYATAAQHLRIALNANPYNAQALTLLGAAEAAQGQDVLARNHLAGALAQNPGDVKARRLLASLQLQEGEDKLAIQTIIANASPGTASNLILSLFPSNTDAIKTLSTLQRSAAAGTSAEAIRLALSQALLLDSQRQQAFSLLDRIDSKGSGRLQALRLKAVAYLRAGESAKAAGIAGQIAAQQPPDVKALRLAAAIYVAAKADRQAEATLQRARTLAPHDPHVSNDLGALMLREGHIDTAVAAFHASLRADPKNLTAMLALARVEALQKHDTKAVLWLQRANASDPNALAPIVVLTRYYLAQHQPSVALGYAQQAVALAPGNAGVLTLLGSSQLAAKQGTAALQTFRAVARAAPADPRYGLNLAAAQLSLKQPKAAQDTLEKLIGKHPDFVPAVRALALIQLQNKDEKAAFATADRLAASQQPGNSAQGDMLKGDLHSIQKDYAAALKSYDAAFALTPSRTLALKVYAARVHAKAPQPGQPLLDWLKSHPNDVPIRLALASHYLNAGQNQASAAQYRQALKQAPDNPIALNNLAWLTAQSGDLPSALPLAEKAHRMAPNAPQVTDTLGWILVRSKQPSRALPLLEKAANASPQTASIHYHYAVALADTGHIGQAIGVLQAILDKHPDFKDRVAAEALMHRLRGSPQQKQGS